VRSASIAWLATALGFYLLMILASYWRWGLLLAAQGVRCRRGTLTGSFLVATFFNNLPAQQHRWRRHPESPTPPSRRSHEPSPPPSCCSIGRRVARPRPARRRGGNDGHRRGMPAGPVPAWALWALLSAHSGGGRRCFWRPDSS
jgi:hypothetical protein